VVGCTASLGGFLGTKLVQMRDLENVNEQKLCRSKIGMCLMQMENLFGKGNFFLEMQP
jgi:hypothetical protein